MSNARDVEVSIKAGAGRKHIIAARNNQNMCCDKSPTWEAKRKQKVAHANGGEEKTINNKYLRNNVTA